MSYGKSYSLNVMLFLGFVLMLVTWSYLFEQIKFEWLDFITLNDYGYFSLHISNSNFKNPSIFVIVT